jgi:hypothetical protein
MDEPVGGHHDGGNEAVSNHSPGMINGIGGKMGRAGQQRPTCSQAAINLRICEFTGFGSHGEFQTLRKAGLRPSAGSAK